MGQQTFTADPLASERLELSGQLAAAQLALEAVIAELSRNGADGAVLSASRMQLASVSDLLRAVGSASPARLAELRGEVNATATAATALANQATGSSSNNSAANANLTPSQRARAAIEAVSRDLFDNKVLDPYLQFASAEDEEAYRKRERERKEEIDRAMALGTPEGLRRAAELTKDQLRDAGEHGADRSPDFGRLLSDTNSGQVLAAQTENRSTEQAKAPPTASRSVADIAATLRAAGLAAPAEAPSNDGHGLSFDKLTVVSRGGDGRC